jgi:hypothetical protein
VSAGLLSREVAVYDDNRERLLAEAAGRWVVIAEGKVQGLWDTYEDALKHGYDTVGLAPFLVKKVEAVEHAQLFTRNVGQCQS